MFTGGSLKLKSGGIKKPSKKSKKKTGTISDPNSSKSVSANASNLIPSTTTDTEVPILEPKPTHQPYKMTKHEQDYYQRKRERLDKETDKQALKSHREKIKEYNEYLANMTEIHDIPRVGPG